jgi:glucosamine-6-phosphate deaminase
MSGGGRSDFDTIVVERREQAEIALAREIAALVREKRRVNLGLATGDTPAGVYRELVRIHREEGLDFGQVSTFNLDEYLDLPPDHPGTFARWMHEQVFARLEVPSANVHIPAAGLAREEVAGHCLAYERAIREAGGVDVQILGIGRNGHVAFNEPGAARESRTREVELHPWTREDAAEAFGGIEKVPRRAITMGLATILEARRIRVLAFGSRKAGIVRRAIEGPVEPDVPATFLRGHPDLRIWIDRAAAAELSMDRGAVQA